VAEPAVWRCQLKNVPCFVSAVALCNGSFGQELSVETILGNHIAAVGGVAAIEFLNNLRIELLIAEPGFKVRGDYRAVKDGPV
jgi:hypothetical protein